MSAGSIGGRPAVTNVGEGKQVVGGLKSNLLDGLTPDALGQIVMTIKGDPKTAKALAFREFCERNRGLVMVQKA